MSRKLTLSGQLCEQLIHDMDHIIAQINVLSEMYSHWNLNTSKQIELHYFSAQDY